jgi:hypothetical protein
MSKFLSSTSLMVGMYSAFVGLFFFTYGAHVEKKALQNQIDNLVNSLTRDITPLLGTLTKDFVASKIPNESAIRKSMQIADQKVRDSNKKVQREGILFLAAVFTVGIGISGLFAAYQPVPKYTFADLVWKNFKLLLVVAVVEFLFFTFVPQRVLSVDPNSVRKEVLTKLKKRLKTLPRDEEKTSE